MIWFSGIFYFLLFLRYVTAQQLTSDQEHPVYPSRRTHHFPVPGKDGHDLTVSSKAPPPSWRAGQIIDSAQQCSFVWLFVHSWESSRGNGFFLDFLNFYCFRDFFFVPCLNGLQEPLFYDPHQSMKSSVTKRNSPVSLFSADKTAVVTDKWKAHLRTCALFHFNRQHNLSVLYLMHCPKCVLQTNRFPSPRKPVLVGST